MTSPNSKSSKPPKAPSKFVPFSLRDSRRLEIAYSFSSQPTVHVNEDYLFEVNIKDREIKPLYWTGPVYEVRRGTWFIQDGSSLSPCEESLAEQIEKGYEELKPWEKIELEEEIEPPPTAQASQFPPIFGGINPTLSFSMGTAVTKRKRAVPTQELVYTVDDGKTTKKHVLYIGPDVGWVRTDDVYGKITSSVIHTLTYGSIRGGTKVVRGYRTKKMRAISKDKPKEAQGQGDQVDLEMDNNTKENTGLEKETNEKKASDDQAERAGLSELSIKDENLEEQMQEEDYEIAEGENQDRKIRHLVLCVHGIGQKLGERLETVNFVHNVNMLRRNVKQTFSISEELKLLAAEENSSSSEKILDSHVQVLPVIWRSAIEFGKAKDEEDEEGESDLSALGMGGRTTPSLADITIEGVAPVRSIISDVLLDILLYYQPVYREQMLRALACELNRIYHLFKEQNPDFKGRVSIFGHSLGSALSFDLLSEQKQQQPSKSFWQRGILGDNDDGGDGLQLDFEVADFFAIGSPIGLFQLLRGKSIASRTVGKNSNASMQNSQGGNDKVSRPLCSRIFNIFHPYDPVAYRLEPIVSRRMASIKPFVVPCSTKGGIAQQITGVGQKLSAGATQLWTGLRSSITNGLIVKTLGYSDLQQKADSPSSSEGQTATPLPNESKEPKSDINQVTQADVLREIEEKIKPLNQIGRLDFALQGGAFDNVIVGAIASHLTYWSEPDLAHFMITQMYCGVVADKQEGK